MIRRFIGIVLIFALSGCVQSPTKVFETTPAQKKPEASEGLRAGSVILDSRPDFEYAMSHVPGASSVHWQDFAQKESPFLGELELDLFPQARRLARYGIRPGTPVVIIGKGLESQGEDYRLAWTLKIMGLADVTVVHQKDFSVPRLSGEEPPPVAEAMWKPEVQEDWRVTRELFLVKAAKPEGPDRPIFIDVRPESSYLGKDNSPFAFTAFAKTAPDFGAINIPWKEFFQTDGRIQTAILPRLQAVGVTSDRAIYVIDEMGVKSAAVTFALRALGYKKAANFAGGYLELLAGKR